MIVADLLTMIGVLDNEQDISDGGSDETRSIQALNMSVDYIEAVAASLPSVLSTMGVNTIKTGTNVESSPLPAALLRVDRLWALDTTGVPLWPMTRIFEVGGHLPALPFPLSYVTSPNPGQPLAYYIDSDHLFWSPTPDAVYAVRAYGLWAVQPFQDRNSAFPYPDSLAFPVAAFAQKYLLLGVDDSVTEIQQQAVEVFTPVLRALRRRDRTGPMPRTYLYGHTT